MPLSQKEFQHIDKMHFHSLRTPTSALNENYFSIRRFVILNEESIHKLSCRILASSY
jgi:hypothetical protein